MNIYRTKYTAAILLVSFFIINCGREKQENYWEPAIQKFEKVDKINLPEKNGVLFVGSSSIRMWKTLAEDFPFVNVLNRGFGGSEISDLVYFAHRIVIPYKPKAIVVYSGDNDIANGKSPKTVLKDFQTFVKTVHDSLPETPIALISIKPSIARWDKVEQMRAANELLQDYIEKNPKLIYIDTFTRMIGDDGNVRPEIFIDDGLHLNDKGYQLWVKLVEPFLKNLKK